MPATVVVVVVMALASATATTGGPTTALVVKVWALGDHAVATELVARARMKYGVLMVNPVNDSARLPAA